MKFAGTFSYIVCGCFKALYAFGTVESTIALTCSLARSISGGNDDTYAYKFAARSHCRLNGIGSAVP